MDQCLCDDVHSGKTGVGVRGAHQDVLDAGAYAEGGVRGQGPGGGGPGDEIEGIPSGFLEERLGSLVADDLELGHGRGVLHVAVAAGLVELMGAQAGACGGRIGLDRIALVQQTFLIYLLEEIPEGLDVAVVVGDVGIVGVHPVADALGQVDPLLGIFHDLAAADRVVLRHGYLLSDVVLGNAQGLLHSQLHGQTVGVPSGLAAHVVAGLSLVAADHVLDGAGHHMVYARVKHVLLLPTLQHLGGETCQVQSFILFEHIF